MTITFDQIVLMSLEEWELAIGTAPSDDLRIKLIEEELLEWRIAFRDFLKETADVIYVVAGAQRVGIDVDEELRARIYEFIDFTAALDGLNPGIISESFLRVNESNMSKLGDDGQPVRREDGKVLKGPNYKPPRLMDLVPAAPIVNLDAENYYAGA